MKKNILSLILLMLFTLNCLEAGRSSSDSSSPEGFGNLVSIDSLYKLLSSSSSSSSTQIDSSTINTSISQDTSGNINVSWRAFENFSFTLCKSTTSYFTSICSGSEKISLTTNSYVDSDVKVGTTYYYSLFATSPTNSIYGPFNFSRTLNGWVKVFAMGFSVIAYHSDGYVYSWGSNSNGELGANLDPTVTFSSLHPTKVCADNTCSSYLQWADIASLSVSDYFVIMAKTDGSIWGWGENRQGNIGDGGIYGVGKYKYVPTRYCDAGTTNPCSTYLSGIEVSAGYQYVIIRNSAGNIYGVGRKIYDNFGISTLANGNYNIPVLIQNPANYGSVTIKKIEAGSNSGYFITDTGKLYSWGQGNLLGDGTNSAAASRSTPQQVCGVGVATTTTVTCSDSNSNALQNVKYVVGGLQNSQALLSDGKIVTWGTGNSGELGNGATTSIYGPVQVTNSSGLNFIAMHNKKNFNTEHSAGVTSDGKLWTWGGNYVGELGQNKTSSQVYNTNVPGQVCTDSNCTAFILDVDRINSGNNDLISLGRTFSIAIKPNGTAWCWGSNSDGQFGNGTSSSSETVIPTLCGY